MRLWSSDLDLCVYGGAPCYQKNQSQLEHSNLNCHIIIYFIKQITWIIECYSWRECGNRIRTTYHCCSIWWSFSGLSSPWPLGMDFASFGRTWAGCGNASSWAWRKHLAVLGVFDGMVYFHLIWRGSRSRKTNEWRPQCLAANRRGHTTTLVRHLVAHSHYRTFSLNSPHSTNYPLRYYIISWFTSKLTINFNFK